MDIIATIGGFISANIDAVNKFALTHPWVALVFVVYLGLAKLVVGIRDAIDTTPTTDDNWFERVATIIKKTIGYLGGFRPKG